jgi:hypothetical protein
LFTPQSDLIKKTKRPNYWAYREAYGNNSLPEDPFCTAEKAGTGKGRTSKLPDQKPFGLAKRGVENMTVTAEAYA